MLTLPSSVKVYLASEPVDMRLGHDGLMAIVRNTWARDPYSGHVFVFLGRRFDRAKLLCFDHGGFVLYYKRLERGRFRMPTVKPGALEIELEAVQLAMLLDGLDLDSIRPARRWTPPRCVDPIDNCAQV